MPRKPAPKTLHQRRLSPVKSFRLRVDAPDSTPNPPTMGGPQRSGEVGSGEVGKGGGPRTPEGKAVSARNSTTHGLFCRQTVLPHLGESREAYESLLDSLIAELPPRSIMERQYLELWTDASWKLRRLSRWEAQVWENDELDEDARLLKIERLMRLQATLRRQLDKSVKMLRQEVPALYNLRLRERELAYLGMSETHLKQDPFYEKVIAKTILQEQVINEARQGLPQDFPLDTLDAANKNFQNEPPAPPSSISPPLLGAGGPPLTPSLFGADTHPCDPRTLPVPGTPPRRGEGPGAGPPLVKPKLNTGNPADYLAYRKREQELYLEKHPEAAYAEIDWDHPDIQKAYGAL